MHRSPTISDEPILRLENLRKTYGGDFAVDEINLDLKDGEFVSFLGPSGSGKTTTLMMIAGLQTPTSGRILLGGRDIVGLPPYKRNIGMVFQHYALFPHMTVARNVSFPLEMRRVPSKTANTQVAEALHRVGLEGFADRLPSQLSGGQQQRVALARALVYKPPLLLLDEPLGALDKQLRQNMQLEIMRLHRQIGTAMLYVTHDQDEALIMSDRIVVFNHGRIQQIGTPVELYEKPQTRFVAGFIGESSFIPGIITARSGAEAIIRTGCGDLRGRSTTQEPIGHSAVLAVRPEKITIGIEQGVDVNNVDARITDFAYIGQHCKVIARLNDGTEITSLAPASHVASGIFCPGKEIKLSWSADDCSVLADDRKQKAIA